MKKELVLSRCIDEVRSGRSSVEDCLKRYPAYRDELKPLLEMILHIKAAPGTLSGESRSRMRARLLAAMRPDGERRAAHRPPSLRPVFTFRLAAGMVAVLVALAIAGGGTVYASQRSLPGDPLYLVKTGAENVQIALTLDRENRADLRLRLVRRRVEEMASQTGRGDAPQMSAADRVATQLDKALQGLDRAEPSETKDFMRRFSEASLHDQLTLDAAAVISPSSKQSLQKVIDVLRRGKLIADVSYDNPSFIDSRPSVTDKDLEEGQFKIAGMLTSADAGTWKIDGITLDSVRYAGGVPPVNSRVRTEGVTRNGKVYLTKVESDEDDAAEVTIEGTFNGSTEGGSVWNVGGIKVTVPQGTSVPAPGDELHLRHPARSDQTGFSEVEANRPETTRVQFDGELTTVDTSTRTITISRAGTHLKVDTTGAVVRTANGRPVPLSQLQSSVGQDVQAKGLYRKDGILYATEVRVDAGNGNRD
jgi:hypothetical protein